MKRRIPARSRACALLVVATLTLAVSRSARAQDSTTAKREGYMIGALVGLPGAGRETNLELFTLGVGGTLLVPNGLGFDFAIGTLPRAIPEGLIPVAARIGPSISLTLGPNAFLIPSAGLSAVAVGGTDDVGGAIGWYGGAATVVAAGSVGLRAGVTWHFLNGATSPLWLAEIGVMHVPLPRLPH